MEFKYRQTITICKTLDGLTKGSWNIDRKLEIVPKYVIVKQITYYGAESAARVIMLSCCGDNILGSFATSAAMGSFSASPQTLVPVVSSTQSTLSMSVWHIKAGALSEELEPTTSAHGDLFVTLEFVC